MILLLAVVPLAVYADTVAAMVGLWASDAYRHGYMIPMISMGLLWRDRASYRGISFAGSWLGVGLLCVLVTFWVVSEATAVQVVEQVSVVLMVSAFVLAVIGRSGYRHVWFPLAFLLLAVPVGATAVPYLMDSTATIAVAALQMLNVPALREGMLVSLPAGTFEVVEACSGFNYLNAGVALGVLVAHLMFRTVWKQILYVGVVVGVFILVNGLRAFIVMYVGSMSDMRLLVGEDHVFFGWVLFLVAMAVMYWLAEKYSDTGNVESSHAPR